LLTGVVGAQAIGLGTALGFGHLLALLGLAHVVFCGQV
jgi:hypothetical protein